MESGEIDVVEWFNKPLIIVRRTAAQEHELEAADPATLRDPASEKSSQPEFAGNLLRSSTAGWFVSLGLGSGSGCAVEIIEAENLSDTGFIDRCDGSRYDLAGSCLLYTSPSPRDGLLSRMPSSA